MIQQISISTGILYLQDKEIILIEDYYPFNMALVTYRDCNDSFIIDTNFLRNEPSTDEYIKIEFKR